MPVKQARRRKRPPSSTDYTATSTCSLCGRIFDYGKAVSRLWCLTCLMPLIERGNKFKSSALIIRRWPPSDVLFPDRTRG